MFIDRKGMNDMLKIVFKIIIDLFNIYKLLYFKFYYMNDVINI